MAGNLTADALRELVASGEIDTVLVCFPDLQGRLMGKRVIGHYFVEHVLDGGGAIEACNYLIALDVDMTPLPGLRVRELGAGLRRLPVRPRPRARCAGSRGSTRPRWCCATSSTSRPASRSRSRPAGSCGARSSGPRRWASRSRSARSSSSSCSRTRTGTPRPAATPDLTPHSDVIEDYHILQTTRDEYLIRQIRNGIHAAAHPRRVLQGRGRQGPARDQPRLRRRARDGRPARDLQERRQGDRRAQRPVAHVHGEVLDGRGRLVVPPPLERVGRAVGRQPDVGRRRPAPPLSGVPGLARRLGDAPAASSRGCSPTT